MTKRKIYWLLLLVLVFTQCKKEDVAAVNSLNKLSIGKSAHDLLSGDKYTILNIEILSTAGNGPDAAAIANMLGFLSTYINKPGGVNIISRVIPATGKAQLSLAEIKSIENEYRSVFTSGNAIGTCLLYLDAPYTDVNTLGLAYLNTSMAVFAPTMQDNSGGINQPSRTRLESIILDHEFGHNLGLVDLGSTMQVSHKASGSSHCNVSSCLMYFSTNVNQMGGIVLNGPLPDLDLNCKNDLKANGGK